MNDKWQAELYDDRAGHVAALGAPLVDLLDPRPVERVLDLGCGTGTLTSAIASRGAEVTGIDSSPEMIGRARALWPDLHFEVADAAELAFSDPFDAVFSNAVLHWILDPEPVIARVAAALRPGGRFVLEFGGRDNCRLVIEAMVQARVQAGLDPGPGPGAFYNPSLGEFASLLERHDFRVASAWHFRRPTPIEGGEAGLQTWLQVFGGRLVAGVPEERHAELFRATEALLRPALLKEGTWILDHWRLRAVAFKRGQDGGQSEW